MKDLMVIDWRAFVKNISYSTLNGKIACSWPTETEEIGHRVAKRFYSLMKDYPEYHIVIANDMRPYWRHDYLTDWYTARELEPVVYKGNRDNVSWPFTTPVEEMERLYATLKFDMAKASGATICQDQGLEADDIFGILAATSGCNVLGITLDSDWGQLVGENVRVFNFAKNEWMPKTDMRVKYIAGDSGDNVKGCPKFKKNGEPTAKAWGFDGAEKFLKTADPDKWYEGFDVDHMEKNWVVTTLPCPLWDLKQAEESLGECSVSYEEDPSVWDTWGLTEPVRAVLDKKAERDAFVAKIHALVKGMRDRANAD